MIEPTAFRELDGHARGDASSFAEKDAGSGGRTALPVLKPCPPEVSVPAAPNADGGDEKAQARATSANPKKKTFVIRTD